MSDRKELQDCQRLRSLFMVPAYLDQGLRHPVALCRRLCLDEKDGNAIDKECDIKPDRLDVRTWTVRKLVRDMKKVVRRIVYIQKSDISLSTLLFNEDLPQTSEVFPNFLVTLDVWKCTNNSMREVHGPITIDNGRIQGLQLTNKNIRKYNARFVPTKHEGLFPSQVCPSDLRGIVNEGVLHRALLRASRHRADSRSSNEIESRRILSAVAWWTHAASSSSTKFMDRAIDL